MSLPCWETYWGPFPSVLLSSGLFAWCPGLPNRSASSLFSPAWLLCCCQAKLLAIPYICKGFFSLCACECHVSCSEAETLGLGHSLLFISLQKQPVPDAPITHSVLSNCYMNCWSLDGCVFLSAPKPLEQLVACSACGVELIHVGSLAT